MRTATSAAAGSGPSTLRPELQPSGPRRWARRGGAPSSWSASAETRLAASTSCTREEISSGSSSGRNATTGSTTTATDVPTSPTTPVALCRPRFERTPIVTTGWTATVSSTSGVTPGVRSRLAPPKSPRAMTVATTMGMGRWTCSIRSVAGTQLGAKLRWRAVPGSSCLRSLPEPGCGESPCDAVGPTADESREWTTPIGS